ncbi:hypothetical protein DVH05_000874 [Phytophthora capsici]|nr:hypothetical protein DVH05_000874 [Phytophthora capsici]
MPLWTLAELQKAAEELTLQRRDESCITDEVIEKRFYTFGGVARECFYLSEDLVVENRHELIKQIGKISNLEDLRTLLSGNENAAVCHRILQFKAKHGKRTATSLSSPFVVEELGKRMLKIVKGKRDDILQSLQDIPEGTALAGWTFEIGVHEKLARGCKLQLRPLPSKRSTPGSQDTSTFEKLTIKEGETDEFTLKDLSPVTATKGPYHKPKNKQFESIDGFYIPKMEPGVDLEETKQRLIEWNKKPENRLILVQATISESHPVNASGILDVLEKLGLKEAVKAHPERVALVFIVPEPKVASYKRQKIRPERHGSLTSVKHIGSRTVEALNKLEIYSINELLEAVHEDSSVVSNQVQESLSKLRHKSYSDAMTKIPQFVCCLPDSTAEPGMSVVQTAEPGMPVVQTAEPAMPVIQFVDPETTCNEPVNKGIYRY